MPHEERLPPGRAPVSRAGAGRRAFAPLLPLVLVVVAGGVPPSRAAEYRDPEGRFILSLPDGYQEIPRPLLQDRMEALRRGGVNVPAYDAAFDRGLEPRFSYPYALLEVVPVPGAGWTTGELEGVLGRLDTEPGAREAAAALDRLGLGNLMRDPRIAFVRWERERQAGVYRITTQSRGAEVRGAGRITFYRAGYITLWFYYLAGTPYADAADRVTAGLTVLPAHRVLDGGFLAGARKVQIWALVAAASGVMAGLGAWLFRRWRGPAAALLLGLALAGCAAAPRGPRTVEEGSLTCTPSGYGTVACY